LKKNPFKLIPDWDFEKKYLKILFLVSGSHFVWLIFCLHTNKGESLPNSGFSAEDKKLLKVRELDNDQHK